MAGGNGQVAEGFADAPVGRPAERAPFDLGLDAHLLTDVYGIILDANLAATRLLQCAREFVIGKPLAIFVSHPDRAEFYTSLTRLPGLGMTEALELRIGRRESDPRDVVAQAVPAGDEAAGRPMTYRWFLRDVTGSQRMERELSRQRELFEGVVNAAEAIILVVDRSGRVLRSNPYLHDLTDLGPEELRGRDWALALLTPEDRPGGRRVLSQALSHGSGRSGPLGFRGPAGITRSVVWSARGLTPVGEPRVVMVGHDVTDLREAQAQVVRAERLAAIGQMAAGLAHESRNALQRGQACLSMLGLRLADRPDVADLLERAQRAQDDLHRLYEGLLNYANPIRLDPVPCDLATVWREAWADVAGSPEFADAELIEAGGDGIPIARVDGFQLRRVFRNLFDNARMATTGPLRVTVSWRALELAGRPALRVGVRDNGPGFPPGSHGRLFEAFFTTKTRGTGLGLALCKRVVETHGGRIEIGPDGPGAEVIITLPRSTS